MEKGEVKIHEIFAILSEMVSDFLSTSWDNVEVTHNCFGGHIPAWRKTLTQFHSGMSLPSLNEVHREGWLKFETSHFTRIVAFFLITQAGFSQSLFWELHDEIHWYSISFILGCFAQEKFLRGKTVCFYVFSVQGKTFWKNLIHWKIAEEIKTEKGEKKFEKNEKFSKGFVLIGIFRHFRRNCVGLGGRKVWAKDVFWAQIKLSFSLQSKRFQLNFDDFEGSWKRSGWAQKISLVMRIFAKLISH